MRWAGLVALPLPANSVFCAWLSMPSSMLRTAHHGKRTCTAGDALAAGPAHGNGRYAHQRHRPQLQQYPGWILGHSEVIEEHLGPDARPLRNLDAIRRGAERARDLVDQILTFGRHRDARRRPLSARAVITEAASLLNVSLPPGIHLLMHEPPR